MKRGLYWLSPGDPNQRTGGYLYNARIAAALRARGWEVEVVTLPGAWPWPCGADLQECARRLSSIPRGSRIIADGLLWPGLAALRETLCSEHAVVVLVHSLLDKEGGGDGAHLAAQEQAALIQADGWIATSPATYRLVEERLGAAAVPGAVVCPGTAPAEMAQGSGGGRLLAVATLTPRKGIRLLIEAVAALQRDDWHLDIVGSTERDAEYASAVIADIAAAGVGGQVTVCGELSDAALEAAYGRADILVHAAHFEAFGMGLAEAVARGIPVVSTPAGALEVLPDGAVFEVPSGQVEPLTQALTHLLDTPEALRAMSEAAVGAVLPTWADAAEAFENALVEVS